MVKTGRAISKKEMSARLSRETCQSPSEKHWTRIIAVVPVCPCYVDCYVVHVVRGLSARKGRVGKKRFVNDGRKKRSKRFQRFISLGTKSP